MRQALRTLDEADRRALAELWVEAWTSAMPTIDFEARRPWFRARLDALLDAGTVLLAERDDASLRIAAFLTLQPGTGEIDQIAVDPACQGRGLARGLLDEAKRLSPAGLTLSVNTENGRAQKLYERAGFVCFGETVNPRSGLPVRLMRWRPSA